MAAGTAGVDVGASLSRRVAVLCWLAIAVEGFDVVVLGTVLPALLEYEPWGLTGGQAGLITSLALVGMLVGSLMVGTITDAIGRRKTILWCVTTFSIFTGLCAFAPTPEIFGALRFLSGLGLGGVLPAAAALTSEYVRRDRGGSSITTMMTGYHVGAVLTAVIAIPVLPVFGWRAMFLIGLVPAVILVPILFRSLPESISFLVAKGRISEAEALAARFDIPLDREEVTTADTSEEDRGASPVGPLAIIFSRSYVFGTLAMFVASFMGLLLVYGLNSWLPAIMREAGYPIGAAIAFLLVLNIGAVLGLLVAGPVSDRYGSKMICVCWFALSAVFLFLLRVEMPLPLTYIAVFITGFWVFSSQVLLYALVGKYYPTTGRATALGWVAGIGRAGSIFGPLMSGFLVGAGLAVPWGFYSFALAGIIASIAVFVVPGSPVYRVGRRSARVETEPVGG